MIKEKLNILKKRNSVPVYEAHSEKDYRGKQKLLYKFLKCDRCEEEIRLAGPKMLRTGGIMELSYVITKDTTIQVALCTKCINPAIAEFDKKEMEHD